VSAAVERNSRVRYGQLPKLPTEVAIPYANTRDGALTPAQAVRAMLDSDAWREVMTVALDALEKERRNVNKVQPLYTCEELESVYLYQQLAGIDTIRQTREHLTSHAGAEARRLLGFDHPRQGKGQVTQIHAVPSEATLSRYRLAWAPKHAGHVVPATKKAVASGQVPTVYDFKRAEVQRQKAAIEVRADLYERLFARWVADYATTPEAAEAARALFMDGTALHSYFNCLKTRADDGSASDKPKVIKRSRKGEERVIVLENEGPRHIKRCRVKPVLDDKGNVVWDGLLTEEQWKALANQDASFRRYWAYSADGGTGAGDSDSRSGRGYSVIDVVDSDGLPIDFKVGPIQEDERDRAIELLDSFAPKLSLFPEKGVRVLVADSGFNGSDVIKPVRALGLLENIHATSGSSSDRSQAHAKKRAEEERRIVYVDRKTGKKHERWLTDGHCNLRCDCGRGEVQKRFRRDDDDKLIPSLEGQCATCGPVTITSGHWAYADKRWHKVIGTNKQDEPHLPMGNPLTFDSPIAKAYSKRRFAVQEGVHSIMTSRFGLIRGPRRVKYRDEVRLQTAMTFCLMHLLAAEQRKRCAGFSLPAAPVRKAA
jgi:hypothetical protein